MFGFSDNPLSRAAVHWGLLILVLTIVFSSWNAVSPGRSATVEPAADSKAAEGEAEPAEEVEPEPARAEIVVDTLNMRSEPEVKNDNVVSQLRRGSIVKIIEDTGDWLQVETEAGAKGYIVENDDYYQRLDSEG